MRRTPLPPRTTYLPGGKPPRARKSDKAKRRWAKHRDPEWCAYIRSTLCLIWENYPDYRGATGWLYCGGRTECAHVQARSVGGNDRGNTVPLCTRHHRQQHAIGTQSFQKLYEINLPEIAQALADGVRWLAHQETPP